MGLDSLGDKTGYSRELKADPAAKARIMSGRLVSHCNYVRPGQVIKPAIKAGPGQVSFAVKEI